ncbi:MAG: flagellar biosynthetic protein FliP [Clostridia bacterium]|nr:flagellar biosynthetic protein FliP [Clostridia bacterium]
MENTKKNKTETCKKVKTAKKSALVLILCGGFGAILTSATGGAFAEAVTSAGEGTVESLLQGNAQTVQIILLLTAISLIPTLLIMLTGFTRIVIVLSIARNAIGLSNMPPNTVIIGLALFITYFVMSPVISDINEVAYQPYVQGDITFEEMTDIAMDPLRDFMFRQTYQTDLEFFEDLSDIAPTDETETIPDRVVIASFVTSELKHAFAIGFFIYVPFIVIDMIVASTLMSMGMMMLPPAMISMPFKILLFVLVDGWQLTIGTLISSFGM